MLFLALAIVLVAAVTILVLHLTAPPDHVGYAIDYAVPP